MVRGRYRAVAAAATFGLATAIIAAQAPGGQAPQNAPPASVDPSLAQGQGRGGSPIQMARAAIKGNNGITGTATLYEIANSGNGHMVQIVLSVQNAPAGCTASTFTAPAGAKDPTSRAPAATSIQVLRATRILT